MHAIIEHSNTGATSETACDSYTWDGITYTSSGTYSNTYTNTAGCDSTATLNLTINNSTTTTDTINICDGESIVIGNNTYTSSGVYSDIFLSANNCDSTIVTNLTVDPIPISYILQTGNDISSNITAGTPPYNYTWNTGENTQQITPNINGDYWVIIEDGNGCVSDTAFFKVEWIASSIENNNIHNLSIFPNPSKGVFIVEFDNLMIQDLEIRILNSLGEIIYSDNKHQHIGEYKKLINLKNYSEAIYFLEIETQKGIINKKLIAQ